MASDLGAPRVSEHARARSMEAVVLSRNETPALSRFRARPTADGAADGRRTPRRTGERHAVHGAVRRRALVEGHERAVSLRRAPDGGALGDVDDVGLVDAAFGLVGAPADAHLIFRGGHRT